MERDDDPITAEDLEIYGVTGVPTSVACCVLNAQAMGDELATTAPPEATLRDGLAFLGLFA